MLVKIFFDNPMNINNVTNERRGYKPILALKSNCHLPNKLFASMKVF